jgi:hypothetical protein
MQACARMIGWGVEEMVDRDRMCVRGNETPGQRKSVCVREALTSLESLGNGWVGNGEDCNTEPYKSSDKYCRWSLHNSMTRKELKTSPSSKAS